MVYEKIKTIEVPISRYLLVMRVELKYILHEVLYFMWIFLTIH